MPFAAAAAAVAGVAGSVISSSMQSDTISSAQDSANAAQQQALAQARADLEPWRTAGATALPRMNALLGNGTPEEQAAALAAFRQTPGYEFARTEGLRGLERRAATAGTLRSGATVRGEEQFAANLADQTFGQHYNRLLQMSQQGLTAAGGSAQGSLTTGQGIAGTNASAGTAQANIIGNQGTAVQNGIGSLYGTSGSWNKLFGAGSGGAAGYPQETSHMAGVWG